MLLIERDATTADACLRLDCVLASLVAAPHGAYKAVAVCGQSLCDLLGRGAVVGATLAVLKRFCIQSVAHGGQTLGNGVLQIVEGCKGLLSVVSCDQYALVRFDIARTDLQTNRNAGGIDA